jgi:ArsR family transcriptional regulator, virulence genes transcriptional regulator
MDASSRPDVRTSGGKQTRARKRVQAAASSLDLLTKQAGEAARMLRLIGNEYRLLILCFLMTRREMKAGELVEAVGLSQSALSQHLGKLRSDGLVVYRRESQTLYYRIADPNIVRILKLLKDIYCGDLA